MMNVMVVCKELNIRLEKQYFYEFIVALKNYVNNNSITNIF